MYLKHSICCVTCTLSCDETREFQVNTQQCQSYLDVSFQFVPLSSHTYDIMWPYNNMTVVSFLYFMPYGEMRGYWGVAVQLHAFLTLSLDRSE